MPWPWNEVLQLKHSDKCKGDLLTPICDPYEFYFALGVVVALICIAGLMAGLTMGLLSLDKLNLQILKLEGSDSEKQRALRVLPLVKRHHLLLVTLLLFNAAANEALPVFLTRLVPESHAIIISVTCVLLFGEILPSAVFTGKSQLAIAAGLVPFVNCLLVVGFPIAYPISKVLDWCVGEDHDVTRYKRRELKALIALQKETRPSSLRGTIASFTPSKDASVLQKRLSQAFLNISPSSYHLHTDEVTIIHGALDLTNKTVCDLMVPWANVFLLSEDSKLTRDCLAQILASGHSRIPVYRRLPTNIVGLLLVKRLIVLDPSDARPIKELMLKKPIVVSSDCSCYAMLNEFQKGRSHLALITPNVEYVQNCWLAGLDLDPDVAEFDGIITIEDVVEELIQEEIQDETDKADTSVKSFAAQTRGLEKCVPRLRAWAGRARQRVQLARAKSIKRLSMAMPSMPSTKRNSLDLSKDPGRVISPTWTIEIATEKSPLLPKSS
ncbi:hypothetical protein LEN26_013861 [Aphanomyces euteiches]|nr:hypothetical protein AeMF1_016982 [Aphanomyces euteiches]KAH9110048.1 hypothetical protein LEN26_013861 [Aphanomyces euteiches]KAH9193797.1 hypothetical protein AeNC1_004215 [Aphanomyces euteiches]